MQLRLTAVVAYFQHASGNKLDNRFIIALMCKSVQNLYEGH